jgi:23S rRNA pseudouridine2605 synthase
MKKNRRPRRESGDQSSDSRGENKRSFGPRGRKPGGDARSGPSSNAGNSRRRLSGPSRGRGDGATGSGRSERQGPSSSRFGKERSERPYRSKPPFGESRSKRPFSSRPDGARSGGFSKREGGFGNREGGSAKRDGAYAKREGGFGKREGGFAKRDGGFAKREGGFGKREGGFAKREGGFAKRESSFGKREGGSTRREGSYGKKDSSFAGKGGSFSRKDDSFPKKDRSFPGKKDSFPKREGSSFHKKEGPTRRREGSSRNRDKDDDRKSFVESRIAKQREITDPVGPARESAPEESSDALIRLNRFIANAGVCSRREADELIKNGLVIVNGNVVSEMGYKVKRTDNVQYDGKRLSAEKPVYILMNKPKGFITTTDDPQERNTVMHIIANACKERVYPVGRLDRNTTGLLLITNDGELADKLTHPSYNAKKIYKVELDRPITKNDLQAIQDGVQLEEGRAMVDDLAVVSDDRKTVGIEIHIGWNRVVRRIFEALDYQVLKLDRVVYAGLDKKDLKRGQWRFLTKEEIVRLKHFQTSAAAKESGARG